jgi:hypothetical protein
MRGKGDFIRYLDGHLHPVAVELGQMRYFAVTCKQQYLHQQILPSCIALHNVFDIVGPLDRYLAAFHKYGNACSHHRSNDMHHLPGLNTVFALPDAHDDNTARTAYRETVVASQ